MFGDLFGNLEEQQAKMKEALSAIQVESEAGDGAVKISANANREILNVAIDKEKLDLTDTEELEDLLVVALNRVLAQAAEKEAVEGQKLMKDMLPPGLGGISDMFK